MSNRLTANVLRGCVISFAALSLHAGTATIAVQVHGAAAPPDRLSVSLSRPSGRGPRQTITATVPGDVEIPSGYWEVGVDSAAWWHPQQIIEVKSVPANYVVPLWTTGELHAHLPAQSVPKEWTATFSPVGTADTEPRGTVPCTVTERTLVCRVPTGELDVRLHSNGYVPKFFSNVNAANGTVDLGSLTVQPGSSVEGTVLLARGEPAPTERTVVVAMPLASAAGENEPRSYSATPDARGFFHIDGVPPGEYAVQARAGSLTTAVRRVRVVLEKSAELHEPLTMELPRRLTVNVNPPKDPTGKPWRVNLRTNAAALAPTLGSSGRADANGTWTSPPLRTATYDLEIEGPDGGVVYRQQIAPDALHSALAVDVPLRELRGKVTLGDRELQADLRLEGDAFSVETSSASDGTFRTYIPAGVTSCEVEVHADIPAVRRRLRNVDLGRSELKIAVPLTLITGDVVDEKGNIVTAATVTARLRDRLEIEQVNVENDGTFSLYGYDPGEYILRASSFLKRSEATTVLVPSEGERTATAHLVVRDDREIHGQVASATGAVAGADVLLLPTDVPDTAGSPQRTNGTGEFSALLPPDSREIDVLLFPPGFAFRMGHTRVEGNTITLSVRQDGGTLVVPAPAGEYWPVIAHDGAVVSSRLLLSRWTATVSPAALTLSDMEPGPYMACMIRRDELAPLRRGAIDTTNRCATGYLAAGGRLELLADAPAHFRN